MFAHMCECCGGMTTEAEHALATARHIKKSGLIVVRSCSNEAEYGVAIAMAKVSLDFEKRGLGFAFRAIVEDWDALEINRQLY